MAIRCAAGSRTAGSYLCQLPWQFWGIYYHISWFLPSGLSTKPVHALLHLHVYKSVCMHGCMALWYDLRLCMCVPVCSQSKKWRKKTKTSRHIEGRGLTEGKRRTDGRRNKGTWLHVLSCQIDSDCRPRCLMDVWALIGIYMPDKTRQPFHLRQTPITHWAFIPLQVNWETQWESCRHMYHQQQHTRQILYSNEQIPSVNKR